MKTGIIQDDLFLQHDTGTFHPERKERLISIREGSRVYPRKDIIFAWAYSHNAVYLIYPENAEVPKDRFGHWASWTSRQRLVTE